MYSMGLEQPGAGADRSRSLMSIISYMWGGLFPEMEK